MAAAGLGCALISFFRLKKHERGPGWAVFFILGATLISWAYYLERREMPPAGREGRPPERLEATLEIERLFRSPDRYGNVLGLARVVEAPAPFAELAGRRVNFRLRPKSKETWPIRSTVVRASGRLSHIEKGPEMTGFHRYLRRSEVYFDFSRGKIKETLDPGFSFYLFCEKQKRRLQSLLMRGNEGAEDLSHIYAAMLLGNRNLLSKKQRDAFADSGTMHFFAISGLHVGMVAVVFYFLFNLLRLPPKATALLGLAALFLYVQITGAMPSALRAFLMITCYWCARLFRRPPSAVSALAASALMILIITPRQLWHAGFQLSYAVVAAILLYGVPLSRHLEEKLEPYPGLPEESHTGRQKAVRTLTRWGAGLFAISFAAALASGPLVLYHFKIFTPGALFLNMLLVPLAQLVITCGFVSILLGLIGLGMAPAFFNHGAWVLIWIMDRLIHGSFWIPGFFNDLTYRRGWLGPVTALAMLGLFIGGRWNSRLKPSLAFGMPVLLWVLVLLFGARPW